uniref:Inosine/uridine-preferring nucleoside hydrolase domain-containing protein n=1 Tax=Corethron hystrix TaxID=216773 RepID=A0A7S1BQZ1_9STRA|mmetsp:Transcript_37742/g.87886  ORF Transcript_37742/g.87886 Transcript_37742/m.87886 type:complete len:244 (+) Transcript_37742:70-801(+)
MLYRSRVSALAASRNWLAIDTDAGIDDAVALCMALKLSSVRPLSCSKGGVSGDDTIAAPPEVKLLTCVGGNVPVRQVQKNVHKCIAACKSDGCLPLDPEVCVGADHTFASITGDGDPVQHVHATEFHGHDGLGDVVGHQQGLCDIPVVAPDHDDGCAADALVRLAQKSSCEDDVRLTLLALGPLTNVALAIQRSDGAIVDVVDELVIMGGCGNGRGNVTRVAEFNIYSDPKVKTEDCLRGIPV